MQPFNDLDITVDQNTLQVAIDSFPDPIFVKNLNHIWIGANQAFCTLLGQPYEQIIGHSDLDFFPAEQAAGFWQSDDAVTSSGQMVQNEEVLRGGDGTIRTILTRKFPLRNAQAQVVGLTGVITDISEFKRRQSEVTQLERELEEKAAIIETQSSLLNQLSVPVIEVWQHILLLPLIGFVDSNRAVRVMQELLETIERTRARIVIIDITGVPVVDTGVAGYLLQSVQAAKLLGCHSILVGISPEVAQTIVTLGVDFSQLTIQASLHSGLQYALKQLNDRSAHQLPPVRDTE